jgi:hypothetical protein
MATEDESSRGFVAGDLLGPRVSPAGSFIAVNLPAGYEKRA